MYVNKVAVNANEILDKKYKFFCEKCNYGTCKKSDWLKHLTRKKHLKKHGTGWTSVAKNMGIVDFTCNFCSRRFTHKSSASRHSKSCRLNPKNIVEKNANVLIKSQCRFSEKENSKKNTEKNELLTKTDDNDEIEHLKEEVQALKTELQRKEIKELQKELEHKDKLIDIYKNHAKEVGDTYNTQNINNTQNISINVFLNNDCKNAMNLTDFVGQIKVQLEDVMYQKDFGAAAGIQNILQKQLKDMSPTDRPFHCTDEKRMQFYIKEDDKWEKDTGDKAAKNIRTVIKDKSIIAMKEWEDANPTFPNNPKLAEEYNKIVSGILEGYGDKKKYDKQIKEVKKRIARYVSIKDAIEHKNKQEDNKITN